MNDEQPNKAKAVAAASPAVGVGVDDDPPTPEAVHAARKDALVSAMAADGVMRLIYPDLQLGILSYRECACSRLRVTLLKAAPSVCARCGRF